MYVILYAVEHKVVFISQVCDIAFSASRKEKSTFSRGDLTLSTQRNAKGAVSGFLQKCFERKTVSL